MYLTQLLFLFSLIYILQNKYVGRYLKNFFFYVFAMCVYLFIKKMRCLISLDKGGKTNLIKYYLFFASEIENRFRNIFAKQI